MQPKVAIVYYSATGTVYRLARAVEAGAREAGAEVRFLRVAERATEEVIRSNPTWAAHRDRTKDVPEATVEDLIWADAFIFGTPTRYGNVAGQLKEFLDSTGGAWGQGKLSNKVAAGFTSAANQHGGQESTLLALYNTMYHWGCMVVPPGYTDPAVYGAGGNPYGVSVAAMNGQPDLPEEIVTGAKYLGKRVVTVTGWLLKGRAGDKA